MAFEEAEAVRSSHQGTRGKDPGLGKHTLGILCTLLRDLGVDVPLSECIHSSAHQFKLFIKHLTYSYEKNAGLPAGCWRYTFA